MVCVDEGVGGKATTRGPFEVRVVTLNTFRESVLELACNITLDFNGLQDDWIAIGCRMSALEIDQKLTR